MRVALQQVVGGGLAQLGVAHHHRHDVGVGGEHRQARLLQGALGRVRLALVRRALGIRALEVAHRGPRRRRDRGRERGGEDEAGGEAPHRVAERGRAGDVAADAAEALGQRALDHVDPVHHALALGHAAAARPVEADRVDLVEIGHRAVALGEVADRADRRHVAVHRVDALERDQHVAPGGRDQQLFQVRDVVVAEDPLLAAGVAHALDHRVVVEGVRQDQAVRDQLGDRRDAGLVRDVARGEDEAGLLAVQVGELALQVDQGRVVAGDVAGAARAHAAAPGRLGQRGHHLRVLAHAEIVVRAPHRDLGGRPVRPAPVGDREPPGDPLDVGEDPVAALAVQALQGAAEMRLVVDPAARTLGPPAAALADATRRGHVGRGGGGPGLGHGCPWGLAGPSRPRRGIVAAGLFGMRGARPRTVSVRHARSRIG